MCESNGEGGEERSGLREEERRSRASVCVGGMEGASVCVGGMAKGERASVCDGVRELFSEKKREGSRMRERERESRMRVRYVCVCCVRV